MDYGDKIKIFTQRIKLNLVPQDLETVMILGDKSTIPNRYQFYSDAASMIPDLSNGSADPEYKAALIAFQQSPRPSKIMMGKKIAGDADYTVALDAIFLETQKFFGVSLVGTRDVAEQLNVAAWVQGKDRVCILASNEPNIIGQDVGTDTTSIMALVKNNTYFNTMVMYHSKADGTALDQYLDTGTLVYALQNKAGSYTLAGKLIIGVSTVDNLDTSSQTNVFDKNGSIYTDLGGTAEIDFGTVADADFFDTIHFMYWSKVRLQEAFINLFKQRGKVKHNSKGYSRLEASAVPVFNEMEDNDAIDTNNYDENNDQIEGWAMRFPETVSQADKSARLLKNVVTNLWYTGAVHKVEMELNIIV